MNKKIFLIRSSLWLSLAIFIIILIWLALVPTGKISYKTSFLGYNYFISSLTPQDRLKEGTKNVIIGDPIYFSLKTARTFDQVDLSVKFKNNSTQPVVEAGVMVDSLKHYQTRPLQNKILDQLMRSWHLIKDNDLILLQKNKKYYSIDDFLKNLPERNSIATYNYDLKQEYLLPNYNSSLTENLISTPLRGGYQFFTYIKKENLDFKFVFSDLNKNIQADNIELLLYKNGDLITSKKLADDGITNDFGLITPDRELNIRLYDLPEGTYKLELIANDDIITRSINSTQQKISFINKLWLANGDKNNIELFTDSSEISAQTLNPDKLQTIKIGNKTINVSETYKKYSQSSSQNITNIELNKNDSLISGDGVFSFSENSLINPTFKKVSNGFNTNSTKIEYIIANYTPPTTTSDGWLMNTVNLNLKNIYREKAKFQVGTTGKYSFIISIPGLDAKTDGKESINLNQIILNLKGTNIFNKLKNTITKWL